MARRFYSFHWGVWVPLLAVLGSCAGKITSLPKPVYNDSVYQQFWTAEWSPDDRFIAVGGVDSVLRIYRAGNLKLHRSFPVNSWIHAVRWHPDGNTLAVATVDQYVQLWDAETGVLVRLKGKGGSRAIGWNHNGELLAVADLDGGVKIWDRHGTLLKTMDNRYGPEVGGTAYLGLDWHPSKNVFVATNFQLTLFDTAGRVLQDMEHPNKEAIMLCVQWHPSGRFFVVGDYGHNWEGENVPSLLHFWSADGQLIKSVAGSKGEYRNLDWNKQGTRLATASDVLRIWTPEGALLHQSAPDRSNYLWGISWNAPGNRIVTASRHKTVALWDSTAKPVERIEVAKDLKR